MRATIGITRKQTKLRAGARNTTSALWKISAGLIDTVQFALQRRPSPWQSDTAILKYKFNFKTALSLENMPILHMRTSSSNCHWLTQSVCFSKVPSYCASTMLKQPPYLRLHANIAHAHAHKVSHEHFYWARYCYKMPWKLCKVALKNIMNFSPSSIKLADQREPHS